MLQLDRVGYVNTSLNIFVKFSQTLKADFYVGRDQNTQFTNKPLQHRHYKVDRMYKCCKSSILTNTEFVIVLKAAS